MDDGVKVDSIRLSGENPSGSIGQWLLSHDMDPLAIRPYFAANGKPYITVNAGTKEKPKFVRKMVANATFRENEWRAIDTAVQDVSKPELVCVGDLRANGLTSTNDGMSTPMVSYEMRGDVRPAILSMNGLREGEKDRQDYSIANTPQPIIHKDVSFDLRHLKAARRGGLDLDTQWIEDASIKVAQKAEEMLLGTVDAYYFGGSAGGGYVYGYRTLPSRITKTLTLPTAAGWTPQTLIDEVIDMRQSLRNKFRRGPYFLYLSTNWDTYLDSDYSAAYNGSTLRTRLEQINGIKLTRSVDLLGIGSYQAILVEAQKRTIRELIGMDIKAVQWSEKGGMEAYVKVMAILTPQLRTDADGNIGVAHGVAA